MLKSLLLRTKLPKLFFKPPLKKILIYDNDGSKHISRYLKKESYDILHTRMEKLCILAIFKCILKLKYKKKEYIEEYIKLVQPKLIITFIDNNKSFYTLKKISSAKTIFIQNGIRTCFNDIFFYAYDSNMNLLPEIKQNNYAVDYMLVWNDRVGKLYNKFIYGECISIGSFRNNFLIKKKTPKKSKVILFISNFKNINKSEKINGIGQYWNFIKNEKRFLNLFREYCVANNLQIHVLGKHSSEKSKERQYYNKFFSGLKNYKFIPADSSRTDYSIPIKYYVIVTIESSLGHEMLSQKKRVAFFSTHEDTYPLNTLYFDWMGKKKNSGPFWTNRLTKFNIKKILDFLTQSSNSEWMKELNKYKSNLINIDQNNKKFLQVIKREDLEECLK
jgi:surface carbohydrate biosynthesis protein